MDKRKIKIGEKEFEYALKKRKGARTVRLSVYQDGYFLVTAPKWYPLYLIKKFLEDRSEWILKRFKDAGGNVSLGSRREDYLKSKRAAREIIRNRVEFFNRHYQFPFGRIAIRNQRTCWGSCSQKGNLNFNYKIAGFPEEIRDYVVVHELCHLRELNHSSRFWKLVAETVPDYNGIRKRLRKMKM